MHLLICRLPRMILWQLFRAGLRLTLQWLTLHHVTKNRWGRRGNGVRMEKWNRDHEAEDFQYGKREMFILYNDTHKLSLARVFVY